MESVLRVGLCIEEKSSHLDQVPLFKVHPMCLRKPKKLIENVDEFPDHQSLKKSNQIKSPKSPKKRKARSSCTVLNNVKIEASLLDADPSLPSKKRRQVKASEIPKKRRSKSVSTVANGTKKEGAIPDVIELGGEFLGHQQPKKRNLTKSPKIVKKGRSKSASTVENDAKKEAGLLEAVPNLVELGGEFSGHPSSKKRRQAKLPKSPKKKKTKPVITVTKNVKKKANILAVVPNPVELEGGPRHPLLNKRKQAKLPIPKNPKRKRSKSVSVVENVAKKEANALDAIPKEVEKMVTTQQQSPKRRSQAPSPRSPPKMRPNSLSTEVNDVKKEIRLVDDGPNTVENVVTTQQQSPKRSPPKMRPNSLSTERNDVKKEIGLVDDGLNMSPFRKARVAEWVAQFERKTDYHNLLALVDTDLVLNVEKFKCPSCHLDVDVGKGVILQECLHSFCKMCLAVAIEFSETAAVKCPFINYVPFYSCESYLQEREVKSIVTPEVYEKYLERGMACAESEATNSFHCRTPACPGWCFIEGAINAFVCPVCHHTNCLTCAAVHEGKTCNQYQNDVATLRCDNGKEAEKMEECLEVSLIHSEFENVREDECEKKTDYHDLLALENVNLVLNVEKFECPICFTDIDVGEGATLQECLHSFCKECLAGTVQHSETAVVRCPFQNDEYSCESYLQEREIKSLVTPEVYEKHLQRSVSLAESQAQNSFHCKTPDCPGWCLFEDAVNAFRCPVCHHTNCLTCAAIHEGKNCRQYQDNVAFMGDSNEEAKRTREYIEKNLNKGTAMKCPQCQIIIMKKEGCDWLTCSMCRTEVCWCTKGPRWGPGGKGDTSGGCRCMVNGVRCHPKCRNCH